MATLRIFISHSHHDNIFGERLAADLRAIIGYDAVWYDSAGSLHASQAWWNTIITEISTREVFIVILSPSALASHWVRDEIAIAWNQKNQRGKNKLIIPLMYQPNSGRPDLDTLQSISFVPPRLYQDAFAELLNTLGIGRQGVARSSAIKSTQTAKPRLLVPIIGLLVIIGIIATFLGIQFVKQNAQQMSIAASTATAEAANITATATALQPYAALVPGPECDSGSAIWTVISPNFTSTGCSTNDLELTQSSLGTFTGHAAQVNFTEYKNYNFPVDYSVQINVSMLTTNTCSGLITRIQKQGSGGYIFDICQNGNWYIERIDSAQGTLTTLSSGHIQILPSYKIEIDVQNGEQTFTIDSLLDQQITDNYYQSTYFLGLHVSSLGIKSGTNAGTFSAYLSNFKYSPIQ